jgi:hypothetical protein
MIALTFIDSNKIKATVDWLQSDRSVAAATWGLVVATLLLVLATLFLYLDGRTKSKEQGARWKREDEFRAAESKPKAYVELGKAPGRIEVHFRCFNLGNTTFLVDKLILRVGESTLTHEPEGPPILLPGTVASVWFNCAALMTPKGGFREVSAVFHIRGASGTELTEPVWFYFFSDPGEVTRHDWRVGRLSERLPGTVVKQPRTVRDSG